MTYSAAIATAEHKSYIEQKNTPMSRSWAVDILKNTDCVLTEMHCPA